MVGSSLSARSETVPRCATFSPSTPFTPAPPVPGGRGDRDRMDGLFSDAAGWLSVFTIVFVTAMMIFVGLWVLRNIKE